MKFLIAAVVLAHSWYPWECCSDNDCKPVPCDEVHINKDGTGTYDGLTFDKVKPSPDGACHACVLENTRKGLCLFVGLMG